MYKLYQVVLEWSQLLTSSVVSRKLQETSSMILHFFKKLLLNVLFTFTQLMRRGTITIICIFKILPVCLFRYTVMMWFMLESLRPLIKHVLFYFSLWLCHFMQKIVASTRLIRLHRNGMCRSHQSKNIILQNQEVGILCCWSCHVELFPRD